MDRAFLHHFSLGIVGLSLGLNGAMTTGAGTIAGAALLAGGACLVAGSAYSLLTNAEAPPNERASYLTVFAAVLSVAGTVLALFG
jgi:hypothetical protein